MSNEQKRIILTREQLLQRTLKSITLRARPYGILKLQALTDHCSELLVELLDQQLPAREFTVQAIHAMLLSPQLPLDTIRSMTDRLLIRIVSTWSVHPDGLNSTLSKDFPPFDAFSDAVDKHVAKTRRQLHQVAQHMLSQVSGLYVSPLADTIIASSSVAGTIALQSDLQNLYDSAVSALGHASEATSYSANLPLMYSQLPISTSLNSALDTLESVATSGVLDQVHQAVVNLSAIQGSIQASFENISALLLSTIQIGDVFSSLPDPFEIIRQSQEIKQAEAALQVSGYGVTVDLFESALVIGVAKVNPKVRTAAITNRILAATRNDEFAEMLREQLQASPTLQRRQKVITRALTAHQQRDYIASIPLLLSQLEGVIGDMLRLKGEARIVGGKVYALDTDGKPKLNDKRKKIELKGMGQLIQHGKWQKHPVLYRIAELVATQLTGDRNHILHGRRVDYASPKLSAQTLLTLFRLVLEVVAVEKRD